MPILDAMAKIDMWTGPTKSGIRHPAGRRTFDSDADADRFRGCPAARRAGRARRMGLRTLAAS
ncbi:hypothetical protein [Streptomyces sp. NPDC048361]|uniref:hypothetical protein n=1 Tax=Streptomyces sp. NPDC048361 TaxID=3154720 RepID=UPI00342A0FA8